MHEELCDVINKSYKRIQLTAKFQKQWLFRRWNVSERRLTIMNPLVFLPKKLKNYVKSPTRIRFLWRLLAIFLVVKIWTMSAWKLRTVSSAMIIAIKIFCKIFNKTRMKSHSSKIARVLPQKSLLQLHDKSIHQLRENV